MDMETIIKIIRLEQTVQGALGAMVLYGHYFCSTLEPDDNDPDRFQIPTGIHACKRFHGQKFKDTFEIIVPDHTALLFHPGNIEADSKGCVLLGQYPGKLMGQRAVLNSGATFDKFLGLLYNVNEFNIEFINFY